MSAAKLSKQLKRELKANPQKAGALGLLCLVAAYFWGPLLFKSEDKKVMPATAAPNAATTVAAGSAPEAPTIASTKPNWDWRTLSNRIESDPSMRSVTGKSEVEGARSPFDAPVKVEKQEPIDGELVDLLEEAYLAGILDEKPVITKQMTSAALNAYPLRLSSTLVGTRARTAIINGKAFAQGTPLGKLNNVELVLEYVDPRSAVVAWNGMRRELRIPRAGEQPPDPPPDEAELGGMTGASNRSEDTQTSAEAGEALLKLAEEYEAKTN